MQLYKQKRELLRCGITQIEEFDNDRGDKCLKASLGEFTFRFQNYYWVVNGLVPISLAIELYEHPIGKTDIRSNGHCGCPHPLEYGVEWKAPDGRKVIPVSQLEEFKKFEYLEGEFAPEKVEASYIGNGDPKSIGAKGYVDMYHIDSELALYLFVEAIKEHTNG